MNRAPIHLLPSPEDEAALQELQSPLLAAFDEVFTEAVKNSPEVQRLIQADEPLLCIWGDGSMSMPVEIIAAVLRELSVKP